MSGMGEVGFASGPVEGTVRIKRITVRFLTERGDLVVTKTKDVLQQYQLRAWRDLEVIEEMLDMTEEGERK